MEEEQLVTPRENEADARIAIDDRLRAAGWDPADKSQIRTEVLADATSRLGLADRSQARPFDTHAPVYDLIAAAGAFGPDSVVGTVADEMGWIAVPAHVRLTRDHFVARVGGRSMEPTIPDGSYALFRTDRGGSREGKLVLVWHRGCADPTLGGEFSVKKYQSTKIGSIDGSWTHREIRLRPLNPDPAYQDLVFRPDAESDLRIIGEFVCVVENADTVPRSGRADYVLYDQRGRPLAVIEAKKNAINPYVAKQQALPYAQAMRVDVSLAEPAYIARFLHWAWSQGAFRALVTQWVNQAAINRLQLVSFPIPLPPLSEQRRIVKILDQADRLRRLRGEADAKAERILPALFIKMFGDPTKNPMGWEPRPLGQVAAHITSGSRGWSKYTGRGENFFVRTQDIIDGEISDELVAVEAPAGAEADRTRLTPGDVVVTITGVVGKAAVFRGARGCAFVSQHVALIRPKSNELNPDYLASYANLPLGEVPVLARFQYGQTKPGLGFRELLTSKIPVPPISLQRVFAGHVECLRALGRRRRRAQGRLRVLWQSVLTSAFSGNLTQRWREAHMNELLREMDQQAMTLGEIR